MQTTEVYDMVTCDIRKINCLRGGSRSSKSYSMIQIAIKWLWTGYIGTRHIGTGEALILRETFPSLRRTILAEFQKIMHAEGFMPFVEWRKSFHEFQYQGRKITFMSLDEQSKVLGMQTAWFWINEPNQVAYGIFNQLLIRCENFCFLDYNPYDEGGWINQEIEIKRMKRGDVALSISTYKMNPYIPQTIVDEIESLKQTDEELFQVYNKGEWAKIRGLIYPVYKLVDNIPTDGKVCIGLDFGYSHYCGMVMVCVLDGAIFLKEIYYEREKLTSDIIDHIYSGALNRLPIIADNARPEAIAEMRRNGLRVRASRKGKDSVRQGINNVKLYKINITSDSVNLIKEVQRYKWAIDNDEKQKEEPVKMWDDLLDATRYGVNYIHRKSNRIKLF